MIKKGFELTTEERLRAAELIDEFQERVTNLATRKDGKLKSTCKPSLYEPTIHTINIGDSTVVVKVRKSELQVLHEEETVVKITGLNIDTINVDALDFALQHIRRYMILDDLANI